MNAIQLFAMVLLSGCSASVTDTAEKLNAKYVTADVRTKNGMSLAIEKSFTGGATGDTLYKAWLCRRTLQDCKLVATIDTRDGPAPRWRVPQGSIQLMVAEQDVIWGFSNFFYDNKGGDLRIQLVTS